MAKCECCEEEYIEEELTKYNGELLCPYCLEYIEEEEKEDE